MLSVMNSGNRFVCASCEGAVPDHLLSISRICMEYCAFLHLPVQGTGLSCSHAQTAGKRCGSLQRCSPGAGCVKENRRDCHGCRPLIAAACACAATPSLGVHLEGDTGHIRLHCTSDCAPLRKQRPDTVSTQSLSAGQSIAGYCDIRVPRPPPLVPQLHIDLCN